MGYSNLNDIEIKVLPTNVPYIGEQLHAGQLNLLNMAYTMLGIENLPAKAERMIEEEVIANDEPSNLTRLAPLECRRKAANMLNDRFGLNIQVFWNRDIESDIFMFANDPEMRFENGDSMD